MVHQQIQQIQQRINNVSQMAGQIRQAEETNRQKLMQLAQEEAFAAQQMNRIQQLCQESISSLQSISYGQTTGQHSYQSSAPSVFGQSYGQGFSAGIGTSTQYQQSPTALFNLATMGPDTYENTMQLMGGGQSSGMTGSVMGMGSTGGMSSGMGSGVSTQTPLSDITTMGPDTYQASREQFGKGTSSLSQIGQQAGITSQFGPQMGQQTTGFTGATRPYNQ